MARVVVVVVRPFFVCNGVEEAGFEGLLLVYSSGTPFVCVTMALRHDLNYVTCSWPYKGKFVSCFLFFVLMLPCQCRHIPCCLLKFCTAADPHAFLPDKKEKVKRNPDRASERKLLWSSQYRLLHVSEGPQPLKSKNHESCPQFMN